MEPIGEDGCNERNEERREDLIGRIPGEGDANIVRRAIKVTELKKKKKPTYLSFKNN